MPTCIKLASLCLLLLVGLSTPASSTAQELLVDISPGFLSSYPQEITKFNGKLYFFARGEDDELWVSDGTPEGTHLVKDINHDRGSQPENLTVVGNQFFFSADDGVHGRELWVSDGTDEGTRLVKDIYPGYQPSYPNFFVAVGDKLFFLADDGVHGKELWVSDGTPEGTTLVRDFRPGPESGIVILESLSFKDKLFFQADDGVHGRELWMSDGTPEGTTLVKDINSGPDSISIYSYERLGEHLYFIAYDGSNPKIWETDGTSAGTQIVLDIRPGEIQNGLRWLTAFQGNLYFFAFDDDKAGLWKSDGSESGTALIKADIEAIPVNRDDLPVPFLGDSMFFIAKDDTHGQELWVTDGTEAGTRMLKDIHPENNSLPSGVVAFNDRVYFTARDGAHGQELWVSNGTTEGTYMLKDIYPGSESALRIDTGIIELNGKLYFRADDDVHGHELWVFDPFTITSVAPGDDDLAFPTALVSAYPNPFHAQATLRYQLSQPTPVRVRVYDMLGRVIATLEEADKPAGTHKVVWQADPGVASGMYLVQLQAGHQTHTHALFRAR